MYVVYVYMYTGWACTCRYISYAQQILRIYFNDTECTVSGPNVQYLEVLVSLLLPGWLHRVPLRSIFVSRGTIFVLLRANVTHHLLSLSYCNAFRSARHTTFLCQTLEAAQKPILKLEGPAEFKVSSWVPAFSDGTPVRRGRITVCNRI